MGAAEIIGLYLAVGNANHLPAWGGIDMLLSTNPIAVALPAGEEPAIILDMATTVAAYGKVKTKAHHAIIEQALKDVPFVWIARQYSFYAVEKAAVKNWQQIFELRPFVQDAWLAKPTG